MTIKDQYPAPSENPDVLDSLQPDEGETGMELADRARAVARETGRTVIATIGETTILAEPGSTPVVR
jgi:hypothetical protein